MTATITSRQLKQYKRFVEDAGDQALEAEDLDKDSLQELFKHGGEFQTHIREGIRKFSSRVVPPSFDPATGKYTWVVDYDQPIIEKIAVKNPLSLAWATDYATDEKFPDRRNGKRVVSGRIWRPAWWMKQDALERECGGVLAKPKEIIDFSKAFPRPALDGDIPLAAPGQFWVDADGRRYYLYLRRIGAERGLSHAWLSPDGEWHGSVRFLVLDK